MRPYRLLPVLAACVWAFSGQALAGAANPYLLQLSGAADYRLTTAQAVPARSKAAPRPSAGVLRDKPFAEAIEQAAHRHDLDPALVHAVIHVESRHRADARSPKGAIGLMQLMPQTAARFGIAKAESPEDNIAGGTRYLRWLLDRFDQRLELALAAYNAGEGAVLRHGSQIPPYQETKHYVPAVLGKYQEWRAPVAKSVVYLPGTRLDLTAAVLSPNLALSETSETQ